MTSPRDRIHAKYCRDTRCGAETDDPGDNCKNLDFLLGMVEDTHAHQRAVELRVYSDGLPNGNRMDRKFRSGIRKSADLIDPYTEHMGQLVRKSDGRPVNAPKEQHS